MFIVKHTADSTVVKAYGSDDIACWKDEKKAQTCADRLNKKVRNRIVGILTGGQFIVRPLKVIE